MIRPRIRERLTVSDIGGGALLYGLSAFAVLLLVGPSIIVVMISFTAKAYINFPPSGFSFKWYQAFFDNRQVVDAAFTSLRVAAWVSALSLALGVPAAYSLVRGRYRGRTALSALMVAPQMLPGMVIGIAMLFFGSAFGFYQSHSMLIVGLTVFCLPFVIRLVMASLAGVAAETEEASANLGASRTQTFRLVTLPQIAAGVLAGGTFVFIEAFDNLTVALFTASPRARPLAVELYNLVQFDSSPVVAAISSLEILLALLIVVILSRTVGLDKIGT